MKILISALGEGLEAKFSERFARADYFVIYDTESDKVESEQNEFKDGQSGVGVKVSQYIADKGVNVVIAGDFGPKAYDTLKSLGIKMFLFKGATVKDALNGYKENKLEEKK